MSMGGSMDETNKLQGHIELLREQQRMQTERHDEFAQEKEEELKAKDLEILHLNERLEKMEEERDGLMEKSRRADEQSDQMEAVRSRVVALEKELSAKDQKIRQLDTNPQRFMELQKYVHEELTRYVERIMRSLDDCKKSQKEAYTIISDLRKAITIEIARKVEELGKRLTAAAEENDAWSNRIAQQDQHLQKLRKEVMVIRKQAHKIEVGFEAYQQQQSLQMLSSSTGVPQQNGNHDQKQQTSQERRIDAMKSEVSKADSAAIAKQAQIDSMIENNKFMRKELDRRSQDTENCTQELVTVSRKNSNANSYVNKATRRLDQTEDKLQQQLEPSAARASKLVSNLVERMSRQDLSSGIEVEPGLSRSAPPNGEGGGWLNMIQSIKFTWE
ncbi:hypothetical protein AAMO2058_000329600 [Amorphochlora amoebiformis]